MSVVLVHLYMKRLKIILLSNYFYIIVGIILSIYVVFSTIIIRYTSNINSNYIEGTITSISLSNDKISFIVKGKETIKGTYYIKEIDFNYYDYLGSYVKVYGTKKELINNTIPNTFNYKKYLYNNYIYSNYIVDKIEIVKQANIFYKIKSSIYKHINTYNDNIKSYLNLFILGDKTLLDSDSYSLYQSNGIWHLFAISGMHISLIILVLSKLLKHIKYKKIIISLVLFYFMFLTNFSASVERVCTFYFLKNIFEYLNFKISNIKILFLVAFILIIIDPFIIYNNGFLYSFIITLAIMLESNNITGNYFIKILKISIISFLASLPITININYEINLLSIILNIFYVPFISLIIFPFIIITFIFKCLAPLLSILITILEVSNKIFNSLKISIIIPKMSFILIIFYYLVLFLMYKNNNKKYIGLNIIIILINMIIPKLDSNYYVYYLDVGQGDSSVRISPYKKEILMIDTGGQINSDYHASNNTILFLKSLGIGKINLLIISHGDADHAKETINILDKYRIDNIIINKNKINNLEQEISLKGNITDTYHSKYFNYMNINDYISDDENYSSIITYLNIYNYRFLFMGDSPKEVEKKLVSDYKIECDFLKVGHHGSRTSSSKYFIDKINPKYSIISVGRNNKYGHPNEEVLNNLVNSKVYRTDQDGSIMIKIKNNKYKIETYSP